MDSRLIHQHIIHVQIFRQSANRHSLCHIEFFWFWTVDQIKHCTWVFEYEYSIWTVVKLWPVFWHIDKTIVKKIMCRIIHNEWSCWLQPYFYCYLATNILWQKSLKGKHAMMWFNLNSNLSATVIYFFHYSSTIVWIYQHTLGQDNCTINIFYLHTCNGDTVKTI